MWAVAVRRNPMTSSSSHRVPGVDAHKKRLVEVDVAAQTPQRRRLRHQEKQLDGEQQPGLLAGEQGGVVAPPVDQKIPFDELKMVS